MPKLSNHLDADDFQLRNVAAADADDRAPNFLQLKRRAVQLPFAWNDVSPVAVDPEVEAGALVCEVSIHISEAFDGAGAALTVGDDLDADRLMEASRNLPGAVGSYTRHPSYRYAVSTVLKLSVTPGAGATAGRGLLTVTLEALQ